MTQQRLNKEALVGVEPTMADLQSVTLDDERIVTRLQKTPCEVAWNALSEKSTEGLGAELMAIVQVWPLLPEAMRAGIMAIIRASVSTG